MKFPKILPIFICFFLVNVFTYAQVRRNLASWTSVEVGYKIDKNWDIGIEGQLRLKENLEEIDDYFAEFSARRELFKGFRLGVGLRYIRENDNRGKIQGYENHFRFHIDANYKHKLGPFRIGYRLRFQDKNELGVTEEEGDFIARRIRFKTGLEYKIKKWPLDPKFDAELFSRFQKEEDSEIDKFRLTLATSYDLKKAGSIGAYYRIESSLREEIKDNLYIIGLKYKYTFEK